MVAQHELSELLAAFAAEIDIPDELHEQAALRYEEVGVWLAEEGSAIAPYSPDIYPQGSFRLGTVVRPIDPRCDYDIDLVCVLEKEKESITQADLKELVGARLRDHPEYSRVLSPSRRAWNLNFPKQFHLDVLPCIPNKEQEPNGLLLTDTDLRLWQKSNPIEYADWFYGSMRFEIQESRERLAKSLSLDVEEVPDWQVKTPLQRAIQNLKRHRDATFFGDPENRPVSIILTTLAAHAYSREHDVFQALLRLVTAMPKFIERRNGRWWVQNPVEPDENFADKWNEKPARRDAFLHWLTTVESDVRTAAGARDLSAAAFVLKERFSSEAVDSARAKLFNADRSLTFPGLPITPTVSAAPHSENPRWPAKLSFKASIRGTLHYQKRGRRMSELALRKVAKNLWVKFVVQTNTPPPYKVYWKVVNTGEEARAKSQLRGTIFEGSESQWEHTLYTGTHWIEAYIVKDGYLVAASA